MVNLLLSVVDIVEMKMPRCIQIFDKPTKAINMVWRRILWATKQHWKKLVSFSSMCMCSLWKSFEARALITTLAKYIIIAALVVYAFYTEECVMLLCREKKTKIFLQASIDFSMVFFFGGMWIKLFWTFFFVSERGIFSKFLFCLNQ